MDPGAIRSMGTVRDLADMARVSADQLAAMAASYCLLLQVSGTTRMMRRSLQLLLPLPAVPCLYASHSSLSLYLPHSITRSSSTRGSCRPCFGSYRMVQD